MFPNRRLSWSAISRGQTEDCPRSSVPAGGRPSADRYSAVVVLHGCSGISSHSAGIADRLGSWRYVALAVDSLGRAASPTAAPAAGIRNKRSTLTQRCVTWRSSFSSMPRGSPFSANRWAVLRRFTPSIVIWRRNIFPSASGRDRLLPGLRSPKGVVDRADPDPDRRERCLDAGGTVPR